MASLMRTANPTLTDSTFEEVIDDHLADGAMTLDGTVHKCLGLILLTMVSAAYSWNVYGNDPATGWIWMAVGMGGGLVVALVTIWQKPWSQFTGPLYAILEGLALGAISSSFDTQYPGIAGQAVSLTFGTLFSLLLAYKTSIIKPSENFKLGVVAATGAIFLVYLLSFLLSFFGMRPVVNESTGWLSVAISGFIVIVAALNLVLDFDFIEQGVAQGAPRYMEWYAAFGLLVTLVWLYVEMLRLLSRLADRK